MKSCIPLLCVTCLTICANAQNMSFKDGKLSFAAKDSLPKPKSEFNMPVIGMNTPKPLKLGNNQLGYEVWESPVDGMRGIAPDSSYKSNMSTGGHMADFTQKLKEEQAWKKKLMEQHRKRLLDSLNKKPLRIL